MLTDLQFLLFFFLKYDRFAIICKEQLGTSFGQRGLERLGGRETKGFFSNKQILVGHLINDIALAIERRMAND